MLVEGVVGVYEENVVVESAVGLTSVIKIY
jgi:hypothetical protein